jgi:23S rRNA-/tRNA-specific pseudouridylate synthase
MLLVMFSMARAFVGPTTLTRRIVRALAASSSPSGLTSLEDHQQSTITTTIATADNGNSSIPNVTILQTGVHHVVVDKPPAVVCHHSDWTGSRARSEIPLLQRVRHTLQDRRVNLIHRLDRGCSGAVLLAMTQEDEQYNDHEVDEKKNKDTTKSSSSSLTEATRLLHASLQSPLACKTYIALVRGEGILHGRNFTQEGTWFTVDRPIADERGIKGPAVTKFRFIASQHNGGGTLDRPRASLVLCRPQTGRWHQIRRHCNGLSHPILGDSTHGSSSVNRLWKSKYDLPSERTLLHLCRLDLPSTAVTPNGISVTCPVAPDFRYIVEKHLPDVLETAWPIMQEEGIVWD